MDTLQKLQQWEELHDKTKIAWKLFDDLGVEIGGKIFSAIWDSFEAYTAILADMLGAGAPEGSWLYWYCYENDMGRRGMQVTIDGEEFSVNDLEDLNNIILKWNQIKT